ncbi:unnamed protein product [Pylaiella littoralis]
MCGGPGDAVATRLERTCEVLMNDVRSSLASFPDDVVNATDGKQPDWVLTSPTYKNALVFVKAAMSVAKKSVALKLPLTFLEPCADRGGWLQANPPSCVFLRRDRHAPDHRVMVDEFWGVLYTDSRGSADSSGARLIFCSE